MKHVLNDRAMCGRKLDSTTSLYIQSPKLRNQRVESTNASTWIENSLRHLILDQKEVRVKLKEDMIIKSNSMDRKKTFVGIRNMQIFS